MTRLPCLCAALFFISPWTGAEIFKCTDGHGNAKYQNFPCPIDSIGSRATTEAPKQLPASAPEPAPHLRGAEPFNGMTMEEVMASAWGGPEIKEVPKDDHVREIWRYPKDREGNSRSILFDKKGHVLEVVTGD